MPTVSLVIPFFDEEAGIAALLLRLDQFRASMPDCRVEVIFVDDHSTDRTGALLAEACAGQPDYRYLRLSRNSGSHVAIVAGMAHASGDCAVFLAADLQDPPEMIPRMIDRWRQGDDVVWAVRESREGVPLSVRVLARTFYVLQNSLSSVPIPNQGADFALLDRRVVRALVASAGAAPSLSGMIAWLGFRQSHIPYAKAPRQHGRSKFNLRRRLSIFADFFVAFTFGPIRFMAYLGLATAFLGFAYGLTIVAIRITSDRVIEGWASMMVAILVLGGIQMAMLGVLGEDLWRTLEESRKRPLFFVEAQRGFPETPDTTAGRDPRASAPAVSFRPRT